ncbi:hypothetical protein J8N05_09095 [Streptomyces sp. BH-SS-21]|uniref:Uncharacterized protein n=1 Tax=Streptomyces liliiviolaceus TaxID=2823109 RepID=A0A941B5Y5_9ACTN|nr:hypothetical protein [Streptomyces liliiviolaceus]MBQ0848367.1 hypothetical protein [Streptomyces liliiviolaceus]
MSVGSGAGKPRAQSSGRSVAGNVAFGAGLLLVLATMTLGGYAGVALALGLADDSFLSAAVPDDGRNALVVGGIGAGGLAGLLVPLILFAAVRGTEEKPRTGPGEALFKVIGTLLLGVYLLLVSFVVAQLGRLLPEGATTLVSVFVVGFSWMPLALVPWERFGLDGVQGLLGTSQGTSRGRGRGQGDASDESH